MLTEDKIGTLSGPVSITIATRDSDLKPHFSRGWGAKISTDKKEMTVILPEITSKQALADIEDNKLIAVTCGDLTTFVTRQFKGRVKEVRNSVASDAEIIDGVKKPGAEVIGQFFGPSAGEGWKKYKVMPAKIVTFFIENLFDQSPGKTAGEKLL